MSTKIYTAYRTKEKDFDIYSVIQEWRKKVYIHFREKMINSFYESFDPNDPKSNIVSKNTTDKNSSKIILESYFDVDHWLIDQAKYSSISSDHSLFDFRVYISVRYLDGYYYLIPYCQGLLGQSLYFLKDDPNLIEYGYWNNTDKPEGVSDEEWDERGIVWDTMIDNEYIPLDDKVAVYMPNQMIIDIIEPDMLYRLMPGLDYQITGIKESK